MELLRALKLKDSYSSQDCQLIYSDKYGEKFIPSKSMYCSLLFEYFPILNRALADTDADGKMNLIEFSIACKLISCKLRNVEVPKQLPPTLIASLQHVGTPIRTPTGSLSPVEGYKSFITNQNIQIAPIPTMSVQPQPAQPIIPPQQIVQHHQPPIIPPQPQIPQQMMTAAPLMSTGIPTQVNQPLIGGIAMPMQQQQPLIGGIPPQMPVHQPMLPTGTVIPTQQILQQAPVAIPPLIPPQPAMIPNMSASQPTAAILEHQQSNSALLDFAQPAAAYVPPQQQNTAIQIAPVASVAPSLPAGPTPPQSGHNSRSMSFSEKAPSIESP